MKLLNLLIASVKANPLIWVGGAVGAAVVLSSDSSSSNNGPIKFVDENSYFKQIDQQVAAIAKLRIDRNAENDARVKEWKKNFEQIPIIGEAASVAVDIGNWIGKKLGSNYAEQNSEGDINDVAEWVTNWLKRGFVPPRPLFTEKSGAKGYTLELRQTLEDIDKLPSAIDTLIGSVDYRKRLNSMGLMTIANSGHPNMRRGIAEAASGNGSLKDAGWYGGKLVGAQSIIAGIASSEYKVSYDDMLKFSLAYRKGIGLTAISDNFVQTLKLASKMALG